ncbi:MAG: hypothetical protein J7497_08520 [Chitinophagaceae bacterium]|nr:hypothetical protein [Chitinophagaceae bacterium]
MKYMLLLVTILMLGCGTGQSPIKQDASNQSNSTQVPKTSKQLNLTVLLDLSDRIDPQKNPDKPEHYERDSTLLSYFSDYFLSEMNAKGSYLSKGKMRVIFHPNPQDPNIYKEAAKLNIDLSKMNIKSKKNIYDSLKNTVSKSIHYIYSTALNNNTWPGSDIWRFFKNDVKDVAVETDSNYRNILVIFTDGYIYHSESKDKEGNRYTYILPELFDSYKLRNNSKWSDKMDKLDFGLIVKRSDLSDLEVLVLEIAPSSKHKNDEDIIRKIIDKWFTEMKVKRWKIINSDLPDLTKQKIEFFLKN